MLPAATVLAHRNILCVFPFMQQCAKDSSQPLSFTLALTTMDTKTVLFIVSNCAFCAFAELGVSNHHVNLINELQSNDLMFCLFFTHESNF